MNPHTDMHAGFAAHPRLHRRPINVKWLATLLLMAGGATMMLGMVWTWLGSGVSVAEAPELLRHMSSGRLYERADRLAVRPLDHGPLRSQVEQIDGASPELDRFNYMEVPLATAPERSLAPQAPRDAAAPVARARRGDIAADQALPPEIRFGTSRPPMKHRPRCRSSVACRSTSR